MRISASRLFQDSGHRTGSLPMQGTWPPATPSLHTMFQGCCWCREEQRTLPRDVPCSTESHLSPTIHSVLECCPIYLSRADSPMYKGCSHGTLLHFSLQSSRLNRCYYHQDLHQIPLHPGSRQDFETTSVPSYTLRLSLKRLGIGGSLQRHPFSGLVHSAGELLHIP